MNGGSRKCQARWNIISETGSQKYLVVFAANYRVRDGEDWKCLDPAGIPAHAWYRMPPWVKLETEPPITSSRLYLAQSREGFRCHDGISTPMYKKM